MLPEKEIHDTSSKSMIDITRIIINDFEISLKFCVEKCRDIQSIKNIL